jgi:hypothetical protein
MKNVVPEMVVLIFDRHSSPHSILCSPVLSKKLATKT